MRTLYLLRHAKSSWSDPSLGDHERPLAPQGRRAANRMARYANSQGVHPELVLCSSAVRARQTLELMTAALGPGAEVRFDDDLYGANADQLLGRLRAVNDRVASILMGCSVMRCSWSASSPQPRKPCTTRSCQPRWTTSGSARKSL
jgi:phosphohistidine phosphatase